MSDSYTGLGIDAGSQPEQEALSPQPAADTTQTAPETAQRPLLEVEAELCTLAGHIAAATGDFLVLLGEFDERDGWAGVGVQSCAHWLSWRCAMSLSTARDHVRVARRLRGLPETRQAIRQGRLSYSKARALCRIATPATETELVETASHATAAQVERLVRSIRQVAEDRLPADRPRQESPPMRLRWSWDPDGTLEIRARLAPEDGAAFLTVAKAIAEADATASSGTTTADASTTPTAEATTSDARTAIDQPGTGTGGGTLTASTNDPGPPEPAMPQRDGGAEGPTMYVYTARSGVCSSELMGRLFRAAASGLRADGVDEALTPEVVVHVDAGVLAEDDQAPDGEATAGEHRAAGTAGSQRPAMAHRSGLTRAHLEAGPALSRTVIERLACDARISLTTHAADGRTLDIGRSSRRPSARQRKALLRRDGGCAMPACQRARFLHAHHVVYWSRGGRTCMDNLLLLCGRHHRLLHEGAFSIEALGRQRFRFRDPTGLELQYSPPLRGDRRHLTSAYAAPDGIPIEPDTVTGRWDGTTLDPDLLISSYIYLRDVESGRAAKRRDPWAEDVAA
jgi:hypothetical protein